MCCLPAYPVVALVELHAVSVSNSKTPPNVNVPSPPVTSPFLSALPATTISLLPVIPPAPHTQSSETSSTATSLWSLHPPTPLTGSPPTSTATMLPTLPAANPFTTLLHTNPSHINSVIKHNSNHTHYTRGGGQQYLTEESGWQAAW